MRCCASPAIVFIEPTVLRVGIVNDSLQYVHASSIWVDPHAFLTFQILGEFMAFLEDRHTVWHRRDPVVQSTSLGQTSSEGLFINQVQHLTRSELDISKNLDTA